MMQLHFRGTRACIEARCLRHARHSALLVSSSNLRLWVDCGNDWLADAPSLDADAILLTHAHLDHAGGLKNGAPCPVYASSATWERLADFPISHPKVLHPGIPQRFGKLSVTACPVQHSFRAPAIALRISDGHRTLFYAPDIAGLPAGAESLVGIDLYIGDGTTFDDSLLRQEEGIPCGHAPIEQQLDWCVEAGVGRAFFTHCGESIVLGDEQALQQKVRRLGSRRGIDATLAEDGLHLLLA